MNSSFKEKLLLIAATATALLVVLNIGPIFDGLKYLISTANTLIVGAVLAFILNVPMKKLEDVIGRVKHLKKSKRSLAIFSTLLIFVLVISGLVSIVWPTLSSTFSQLVEVVRTSIPKLTQMLEDSGLITDNMVKKVNEYLTQLSDLSQIASFLTGLTGNVTSIFSGVFSIMMSLFFTLSILSSKEHLQSMTLRLLQAILPQKWVRHLEYIGHVVLETYDNFLSSQLIEATIIGGLIFVSYTIFGFPYAGMAGILAGVLSFIPYVGPLAACIIAALFISVQSPLMALGSILLYQVIQLIEGNVIYPRVVGQSVGLPPLFTLSAALIGGNLFGLLGMIFFTPIFAVIYRLVREFVNTRLEQESQPSSQAEQ